MQLNCQTGKIAFNTWNTEKNQVHFTTHSLEMTAYILLYPAIYLLSGWVAEWGDIFVRT